MLEQDEVFPSPDSRKFHRIMGELWAAHINKKHQHAAQANE